MNPWLELALNDPLLQPLTVTATAGLLAYLFARIAPVVSRLASLLACAISLWMTIRLFTGPEAIVDITWLQIGDFPINLVMTHHVFGTLIAVGGAFFGLLMAIYAAGFEKGQRDEGRYHAFLCWTLTGTIGAALADDLIWLLICWELVTLCLYMLLNMGRGESPAGAAKTFGMIGFGDAAMLLAIALISATQETTRISALSINVDSPLTYICYLLFMIAALAKAGAVPMHTWIPTAAADASAAVFALLPASIDKLLGVYLLVRVSLGVFTLSAAMQTVLLIIGAITVVAAAFAAMMQTQFKKLISYQAVSSTGYIVLGIGTCTPIGLAGAIFHAINAAVYQACLFLAGGNIERRMGTAELDRLGGLGRSMPVTMLCTSVAALAISGVPPLNGFVSKWLIYQSCLAIDTPLAMFCLVAAVFGSALTLAASVKYVSSVFGGQPDKQSSDMPQPPKSQWTLIVPMAILAVLCLSFGILAQWPLDHLILPALADLGVAPTAVDTAAPIIVASDLGLWGPMPATMLILLGILGGLVLYGIGRVSKVRVENTFIGGEVLQNEAAIKFPATGFYRTIEELPQLGAALRDGEAGAFDVYRLGGRYGGRIVEGLRRLHTGVLSLYVSWCLVGVVVVVAYLMLVL